MVGSRVAELGLSVPVTRIGVRELPVCGTNEEVLAYHRLDTPGLLATMVENLSI